VAVTRASGTCRRSGYEEMISVGEVAT
jgi:hypothetical protein